MRGWGWWLWVRFAEMALNQKNFMLEKGLCGQTYGLWSSRATERSQIVWFALDHLIGQTTPKQRKGYHKESIRCCKFDVFKGLDVSDEGVVMAAIGAFCRKLMVLNQNNFMLEKGLCGQTYGLWSSRAMEWSWSETRKKNCFFFLFACWKERLMQTIGHTHHKAYFLAQ